MCELRISLFVLLGQRDPDLYAVEFLAPISELVIGAFGVDDAASGGHPVNRPGLDGLHAAETIPMNDRALEQVGHGGKTDVRMRTHVDPCSRRARAQQVPSDQRRRTALRCAGPSTAARVGLQTRRCRAAAAPRHSPEPGTPVLFSPAALPPVTSSFFSPPLRNSPELYSRAAGESNSEADP